MIFSLVSSVAAPGVVTAHLVTAASNRLWTGFGSVTLASYQRMLNLYLTFLVILDLLLPGMSTLDILAFMESLAQSGMSPDNITSHLADVRSLCIVYNSNTQPFRESKNPLILNILRSTMFSILKFPSLLTKH